LCVKADFYANILSDLELSEHDDCALACGTTKGFVVAVLNAKALIVFAEVGDKIECNLESASVNLTHLSRGSQWIRPITCGSSDCSIYEYLIRKVP
jgi:hypothetical protein